MAVVLLLGAAACREGGQASAAQGDGAGGTGAPGGSPVSGDVVIAPSTQRYQPTAVATPGTVSGVITTAQPIQPLPPHPTGPDSLVCGATVPDESVVQRGNGLGGVVVWLDGIRAGKAPPMERRLELESDRCRLIPRVQAGVMSSAVNVIGHDDFRQHLQFAAAGERGARATVLLGRDEQVIPTELPFRAPGLVVVRDTDHRWPIAFLAVFDHPYFTVTAPDGSFTIDGVPPGRYTLRAWHERTKRGTQTVEVTAGGTARVTLTMDAP